MFIFKPVSRFKEPKLPYLNGEKEDTYQWDGGGMREAIINSEDGVYYLSYDGAMPGAEADSYWNACQAESTDLIHWEKTGPKLLTTALTDPDATPDPSKDLCSTSSPWSFYADGKWYHHYLGTDHCNPQGIPVFAYSTMLATSDKINGEEVKNSASEGCGKHVCLTVGDPGTWNDATASPGHVIINPKWESDPDNEMKYLMFYSGSCLNHTKRSIGIARTKNLSGCDDFDKTDGNFWIKDPEPIIPPEDDI